MSDIGDTIGIGIRLEDDGSVGQYAQNLEQLIVRAINAASDVITSSLKQALLDVAGTFGSSFAKAANVAKGSMSGVDQQASTLKDRLEAAEASAAAFAEQLDIDPDAFKALSKSAESLQEIFNTLSDPVKDFSAIDLRRLRGEFDALRRASVEQLAQFQSTQSSVRTLLKSEADERRQLSRERASADKSANSLRIVQEQTSSAQIVAELRGASQERVALIQQETRRRADLFKAATATIVALERSLRSVFEQTGKVLSGAFRGLTSVAQTSANSIRSVFERSNRQITDNYGQSFRQQEQLLQNSVKEQSGVIRKFAEEANQSLGGIGGGRLAAAGAIGAIGGFLASSLRAGFNRFATLQEATRGLDILLNDATKSAKLLDGVLDVVRGTPFGLELFADAAAQLVTFNLQAKEIPPLLAAIGDAAALKGSRAPEFIGRLVSIFGRISTQARVTGEDLARLQEAGVPALQILGNQLGKTTLEIRELVSSGAVGREAIEQLATGISQGTTGINGATVAFAGLAKSLGQTLRGSIANLGAARARLGAAIIGPFNDAFVGVVGLFTKITDQTTKLIQGLLNAFTGSFVFAGISSLIQRLNDDVSGVFERLRPILAAVARTLVALGGAFLALNSARIAATAVSLLGVAVGRLASPLRLLFAAATGITFVFTRLVRENAQLSVALRFLRESVIQIVRPFQQVFAALRDGTSSLRTALRELFEGGLAVLATFINNVIAPALFGLGILIRRTVVPAVENLTDRITQFVQSGAGQQFSRVFTVVLDAATVFANFVGTRVLPVLARIAAVITGVVIVAVEQFVGLIQDRVLPVLATAVTTLREFATTIGTRVPEAFRNFGRAIGDVFSDRSFGGIATALKDSLLGLGPVAAVAGAAVALSFVNPFLGIGVLIAGGLGVAFGPQLLSQIQPRLNDLRNRVAAALNFDNLLNLSLNVLSLVNRLGRVLGRVVSDPRLVAAVAGIAAVGVALAGSFVVGVIQGISDNVPKIVAGIKNIIGAAFVEGFKSIVTDPIILGAVTTAFLLIFGASRLLGPLAAQGTLAAKALARGGTTGLAAFKNGPKQFVNALIGTPAQLQSQLQARQTAIAQSLTKSTQSLQRVIRSTTGKTVNLPFFSPKDINASTKALRTLNSALQDQVARFGAATVAGRAFASGLSQISSNLGRSGERLAGLRRGLADIALGLKVAGKAAFGAAGAAAGAAFSTAFLSSALFDTEASTGDQAGSILGLVATFGATAAIAGAPVAALGLGVGLLAGAFKASSDEAKKATARIKEFADLVSSLDDPEGPEAVRRIVEKLLKEAAPDQTAALTAAGLNIDKLLGFDDEALARIKNLTDTILPNALGKISRFINFSGQQEPQREKALRDLAALLGISEDQAEALVPFFKNIVKIPEAVKTAADTNNLLLSESGEFLKTLSGDALLFAQSLLLTGLPLDEVRRKIADVQNGVALAVAEVGDFVNGLVKLGILPLEQLTALSEMSKVRLGNLRNELGNFQSALERIDVVIDGTRANIKRLLTGDIIDSSQATDAAIIAVQRIGESLQGLAGKTGQAAQAEARTIFRELIEEGEKVLSAGIDLKTILTVEDARTQFAPLLAAADEIGGVAGAEIRKQLELQLERFDTPAIELAIETLNASKELETFAKTATEQLETAIKAEIVFEEELIKTQSLAAAQLAAQTIIGESGLFENAGLQLTQGLIVGFEKGEGPLVASLEKLLGATIDAGKDVLQSDSPSRLAANVLGLPISQGVAVGILEGLPLVTGAIKQLQTVVNRGFGETFQGVNLQLLAEGLNAGVGGLEDNLKAATRAATPLVDLANPISNVLAGLAKSAGGAKQAVEELDLAINDLQRSLLEEFDIFDFDLANPFNEVVFDEGRKALNDLLTSIGGVADQFAKGLRDGTIAGVAASANAFGEFEQKVVEGLRQGIIDGSIQGVDDVTRTLDQIGIVVAQQLGPKNQAAIDEFDKLIDGLRDRSDIEALIIVELEEKAFREAQEKLAQISDQISRLSTLTSRVFRGLLTQIEGQVTAAQNALTGLFDSLFDRNQLPGGPLGLPDIGVIEDYAKKAGDALTGIFDRLLNRNQLATAAVTGDLDELLATRGAALDRITVGESLIDQLRAESEEIENELRAVGGGLAESFRTFFERGSAGEGAFRAQARAIGLSATEVENLIAKQRQLRVAQRDIAEALLVEAETSGKIAEEREKLRTANIELLESSIALLDNGEDGARIFRAIADAAGLNASEIAELTEAYRKLRFEEQAQEIGELAEQDEKLRQANQELLESSLALIDAGPNGIKTFRDIGLAAGLSELEIQNLINKYNDLRAVVQQQTALELTLQQLELESSIRDSALALQELIDLGPEGSDFFNRLAELSGLNVDTARDLILEYGDIVARNSGAPPSALFEGLRQFADSNVEIAQVLLDEYGNIVGEAGKDAPTRFFASLDGQINATAAKISGVAASIADLNAQLNALEQVTQRPGFEGLDTIQIPGVTASGRSPTGQPVFTIQNATFARPSDADLVAQRVNAAIGSRR